MTYMMARKPINALNTVIISAIVMYFKMLIYLHL
jgi:hypothetical protein